jgi:hypothetical protein
MSFECKEFSFFKTPGRDDGCGAIGGMIGRGNGSIRRKPASMPLCSSELPHKLTWTRTRASSVRSQRLTAWAAARPKRKGAETCLACRELRLAPAQFMYRGKMRMCTNQCKLKMPYASNWNCQVAPRETAKAHGKETLTRGTWNYSRKFDSETSESSFIVDLTPTFRSQVFYCSYTLTPKRRWATVRLRAVSSQKIMLPSCIFSTCCNPPLLSWNRNS